MAQMICWNCDRQVDDSLRTCPTCFAGLRPSQDGQSVPDTGDNNPTLDELPPDWDPDREMAQQAAAGEINKACLWLVGGFILAGITYAVTGPGAALVLFCGAIAYGAFRLCRGLYYETNPDSLLRRLAKGD